MFQMKYITLSLVLFSFSNAFPAIFTRSGTGISGNCSDAYQNAIIDALDLTSDASYKPVSLGQLRKQRRIIDTINSNKGRFLIRSVVDTVQTDTSCRLNAKLDFDSSVIGIIHSSFQANMDIQIDGKQISKTIIQNRKALIKTDMQLISRYIQNKFRRALSMSIERKFNLDGIVQTEDVNFRVNSTEYFVEFVQNIKILLNEVQDQYGVSPSIYFDFIVGHDVGKFEIRNSRYLERGLPVISADSILRSKFSFAGKATRRFNENDSVVPEPIRYDIHLSIEDAYPTWETSQLHSDMTKYDCLGRDSSKLFCVASRFNELKSGRTDFTDLPISAHGVDFNYDFESDSICYLSKTSNKFICWDYSSYYSQFEASYGDPIMRVNLVDFNSYVAHLVDPIFLWRLKDEANGVISSGNRKSNKIKPYNQIKTKKTNDP